MNVASSKGQKQAVQLRDWLSESDYRFDPQALVLSPAVVVDISRKIIKENTPFKRAVTAARVTVETIREAIRNQEVQVDEREIAYLDIMDRQIDSIPDSEDAFIANMIDACESEKFVPAKYDL